MIETYVQRVGRQPQRVVFFLFLSVVAGSCAHSPVQGTLPKTAEQPEVNVQGLETAPMTPERFQKLPPQERYRFFQVLGGKFLKEQRLDPSPVWPSLKENLKIAVRASEKYWASSTNFDEIVKSEILPQMQVKLLGIPSRKEGDASVVSAGVMHTYGYLFSELKTPYGLKSKRWLESRLDENLGLPAGILSPFPSSGELLSNLTWVLDRLTQPTAVARRCSWIGQVAKELCELEKAHEGFPRALGFVEQDLKVKRQKHVENWQIRTYIIPYLKPVKDGDSFLLAYEVRGNGKVRKWVTAFPIAESFATQLMVSQGFARTQETSYKPKFNLFLDLKDAEISLTNRGFLKSL